MTTKNYQIIRSLDGFKEAIKYLVKHEFASFDIETDGKLETITKVIGFSFACEFNKAYYVVLREWNPTTQILEDCFSPEDEAEIVNLFYMAVANNDIKLIMHNGVYDIVVMHHSYDVDLTDWLYCDTILLKHTVDEEHPFGLKDLAKKYAKQIGFSEQEVANQEQEDLKKEVIASGGKWTKKQKDIYKGTAQTIGMYGAADTDLTLRIFDYLETKKLAKDGLFDFFYNKEVMPLYKNATIPMKINGVYVDVDYFKQLKNEVETDIIRLTDEVFRLISKDIEPKVRSILDGIKTTKTGVFANKALEHYGISPILSKTGKPTLAKKALKSLEQQFPGHPVIEYLVNGVALPEEDILAIKRAIFLERKPDQPYIFNLNSTHHLGWLLFDVYKCKPKDVSRKTGKPKVDKNALLEYGDLPFIATLAKLKKEEKTLSTYILPILEKQKDGKLYPSMLQFGTTSGRYSCAGGLNLQTLPRDDKRIKKGFIAPPGYKVVNADFSSLEPRIFSWVSKDPGLKAVYLEDLDLYSKIAIDVFKLKGFSARESDENFLKKKAPEQRNRSKIFTLAVPYGANEFRIGQLMGIPTKDAAEIINDYLDAYPNLRDYMENQELLARKEGKVSTQFGRVRHLPLAKEIWNELGERILDKFGMALDYSGPRGWQLYQEYKKVRQLRDKESKEYAKELREKILKLGGRGVELYYKFRNLMNNAKNFPIQSSAASVCNAAMIKLALTLKASGLDAKIVLTIHDEITCIASDKDAEAAGELLKDAMEHNWVTDLIDIPMLADPIIAQNFAEAK